MKNTELRPGVAITGQTFKVVNWKAYMDSATPEERANLKKLVDYGKRNIKSK